MNDNENALVPTEQVPLGSVMASTPHDVIVRGQKIAQELVSIVEEKHLYKVINQKKHIYVDAWTALAGMLGVTPLQVAALSKVHEDGTCEEWVELVRNSDGAIIGRAKGLCSLDEPNWKGKPLYARSSMAATRATGKACRLAFSWIVVLAGLATTPAEEMDVVEAEFKEVKREYTSEQIAVVLKYAPKDTKPDAAVVFLTTAKIPVTATPEKVDAFYVEYNRLLADGASKKDAAAEARKVLG